MWHSANEHSSTTERHADHIYTHYSYRLPCSLNRTCGRIYEEKRGQEHRQIGRHYNAAHTSRQPSETAKSHLAHNACNTGNMSEERRGTHLSPHKYYLASLSSSEPQSNTSRVPSPSRSSFYSLTHSYDVFELLKSGAVHLKRQEFGSGEWQKVVSMPNRAQHVIWQ